MNFILTLLGKLVLFLSRTLNLGSGSTWPGHVAMETNPKFIRQVLKKNPNVKVIIIAGTNGKTTTSLMLQKILEEGGLKVFRNEAGANLLNGIASSIVENVNLTGRLNFDAGIFEVDERNVTLALKEIDPYAILLLNIFRDQLDRYGEVNQVLEDWKEALSNVNLNTPIFTNGDDPALSFIAQDTRLLTYFFGIEENLMKKDRTEHDVDFIYCPNCQTKLEYQKVSYSHMGKFKCPECGFANPRTEIFSTLPHPLLGSYNIYNTNAAALVANKAFGISKDKIRNALEDFKPAFGRQEIIKYKGREVLILLSKNPAGFNQSISAVLDLIHPRGADQAKRGSPPAGGSADRGGERGRNILILLNDRIPDGRDVSWIWDVDFEKLPENSNIFISGDRAYDMGLRIKYSIIHNSSFIIYDDLQKALETAVNSTKQNGTLFILPTYSAMLEARKILTGRSIL